MNGNVAGAMTEHTGTVDAEARGKAAEALQAVQSLERLMDTRFVELNRRVQDGATSIDQSMRRSAEAQGASEGRINSAMTAMEARLMAAVGKVEKAMNDQSSLYSNRFWDTSTKIIFGLVGALWAAAFAYSVSRFHG